MTDLTLIKGSTFSRTLRWETSPYIYKAISAITKAAPAVVTATGHGLVDGWRAAVAIPSSGGMRQIAAKYAPPRATDFHKVTYIDANSVSLNDVNSAGYDTYTASGYLVYLTPVNLSGFSARMQIRDTAEATGTPLLELTSADGEIVIDNTAKTITVTISATATAALTFTSGVYDLEMVSGDVTPVVTRLLSGNVVVAAEVTR